MTEKVTTLRPRQSGSPPSNSSRFKAGDEVILKVGGHYMVVREVDKDEAVICEWHDENGTPHYCDYLDHMLMLRSEYLALS